MSNERTKEMVDALDKAIRDMTIATESLDNLEKAWVGKYPSISWITHTDGWERYISIYRALSNLKDLRESINNKEVQDG